jgi:periplasmic divalent cation tolerance protein
MVSMTEARLVLTTVDNRKLADELAHRLVELKLAACVNIVDRVHSVYRWKGQVETADEILLIVKTSAERVPALKEKILQLHTYELPELIVLEVIDGTDAYLSWVLASSRSE